MLMLTINDLIDYNKIESNELTLQSSRFNLLDFAYSVAKIFKNHHTSATTKFKLSLDKDLPPHITSDRARLERVLLNLLLNAQKFTQKGTIRLVIRNKVKHRKSFVYFEVHDTGIGIAKEKLKQVF